MTLNLTSPEEGGIIVWENGDYSAQVLIAVKEQKTLILLGCAPKLGSQATPAVPSFTKNDGLANNSITGIAVTANGIVWLGTRSGLSRFDGTTWTNYTEEDGLANNRVNDVAVDQDGRAWMATNNGVSCFDGQKWKTFTIDNGLVASKVMVVTVAPDGSL